MSDTSSTSHAWRASDETSYRDWRWLSRLSLVEPLVAVSWYAALARTFDVPVRSDRSMLLFGSLWLIYMADRVLDVQRMRPTAVPRTERHRFVHRHLALVMVAWCAVFLASVTLACSCLTPGEWTGCLLVMSAALLYMGLVHGARSARGLRERGAKELGVSFVFALGSSVFVWSSPRIWSDGAVGDLATAINVALALLPFFLLALQNVVHLADAERHIDAEHDSPSMAWRSKPLNLERLLCVTLVLLAVSNVGARLMNVGASVIALESLLAVNVGASLASVLLLVSRRLLPTLSDDAHHVLADCAVLLAALPPLAASTAWAV
jgi:hypothetical protein